MRKILLTTAAVAMATVSIQGTAIANEIEVASVVNEEGELESGFYFRYPTSIKMNNRLTAASNNEEGEEEEEEEEVAVACYDPSNVGQIGTFSGCQDMLIVDRDMLDTAVNDESYAISHEGVDYTFDDSEYNVFTGQVTDMDFMFFNASPFNQDIGYWDVSNVTNMFFMFMTADISGSLNLSGWNTANVTNMGSMFGSFNGSVSGLENWNVSNVTNMASMFSTFNGSVSGLENWNVSNVTSMNSMFYGATSFNQNISNWDVSNVTHMGSMFNGATSFNQNISNWDVYNVTSMSGMFQDAIFFNQDLSSWCVSNFSSKPPNFDNATTSWIGGDATRPQWGTCP